MIGFGWEGGMITNGNWIFKQADLRKRYWNHTDWTEYKEWDKVLYPVGRGFKIGNFIGTELDRKPLARFLLIRDLDTGEVSRFHYWKCRRILDLPVVKAKLLEAV